MPDVIPYRPRIRPPPRALPLSLELVLLVNQQPYLLTPLRIAGRVYAWQLRKSDGTSYQLAADFSSCDCPDAVYAADRPGGCKHAKAGREMLAMMGGG